ncbi:MAG: sigma-70 family RNA polymerase sigma factor, partial [Verrucomicrobiota bacterium]
VLAWQQHREAGQSPLHDALKDCIQLLPDNLRAVVTHFYIDDCDGQETAERAGISHANVRKRLERARAQLHTCLTGKTRPSNTSPTA